MPVTRAGSGSVRAAATLLSSRYRYVCYGLIFVVLLVVPAVASSYALFLLALALVWTIGVLGTNLICGYAGQFWVAGNVSFACGAYCCAIGYGTYHVPYIYMIVLGGALGAVLGFAVMLVTARLKGLYLATATLTVGVAVPVVVSASPGFTGGDSGLIVPMPAGLFGSVVSSVTWLYILIVMICGLLYWFSTNLIKSHLGRAWIAVRDREISAKCLGIPVGRTKCTASALGSGIIAVAGALYVLEVGIISSQTIGILLGFNFYVALVVGGSSSIAGPVIGGLFLEFTPMLTSAVAPQFGDFIYGWVLIIFVMFAPAGVVGLLSQGRRKLMGQFRNWSSARMPAMGRDGVASFDVESAPRAYVPIGRRGSP